MITDRALRNLKPAASAKVTACGEGLYIRVQPTGSKTFIYRDRTGGTDRWVTLGKYPVLTLSHAREKVTSLSSIQAHVTVNMAFTAYYKSLKYKRPELVKHRMEKDILPTIGSKNIAMVTRQEISHLLQIIVDRGAPVLANRTLADVKHLFSYAYEKGWVDNDVMLPLTRKAVGGKEQNRDRNLSWDEVVDFMQILHKEGRECRIVSRATVGIAALLLLTGQRISEVINSKPVGDHLVITGDLSKTKREHSVYLPRTARVIYRLMGMYNAKLPKDYRVVDRFFNRAGFTFTPHDLRRTFASRLSDLGVMPHIIEKLLNHKMEGVMAVYNRAEYLPERKAAMELWVTELNRLRKKSRG